MDSSSFNFHQLREDHSCDGFIITDPPTIQWALAFESSNALLYLDAARRVVVTDGRYKEAAERLPNVEVVLANQEDLPSALARVISGANLKIGFQAEHTSVEEQQQMKRALPDTTLVPLSGLLVKERGRKYSTEVAAIEQAQKITDQVFTEILDVIKPGMTEKELAAELVYRQLRLGADNMSFWPTVGFGPNCALPHAKLTDRKIEKGDIVLLDFGCTYLGYCSDMTRTVAVGEPSKKFREVYETVLKAQAAALEFIAVGKIAKDVDAVAREIIKEAGYELPHGLGHGLGIEIHEWPAMNPRNPEPLPEYAAVTVEPGIYIPGEFGVRIEDLVILRPDGVRNLTKSPKELIVL